ncbi:MAG: phage major capsid protein, P2 family [Thiolinea sp.]
MNIEARQQFSAYLHSLCSVNGISSATEKFTVAPAQVQMLVDLMQEDSKFLKSINVIPVSAQTGEKLGLGIGSPIASRTDTTTQDRETRYVGTLTDDQYKCEQTNFDTHVTYQQMDSWAHLVGEGFRRMYSRKITRTVGLNRIMAGWNGVRAAKQTDLAANPLLQDVNIGWLEKCRLKAPRQLMGYDSEGVATVDLYQVGEGGHYGTLDALVFDIIGTLLDAWYQEADDLVLILGRELWVNHGLTLYNENRSATERNALETWFAREAVAGLPTVTVPYFPKRGLVVTSYDNLSLYYQAGSTRRTIIDNPKRDRVEEYLSSNDAYVIEDYGKFGGVRPGAIQLKNAAGEWY